MPTPADHSSELSEQRCPKRPKGVGTWGCGTLLDEQTSVLHGSVPPPHVPTSQEVAPDNPGNIGIHRRYGFLVREAGNGSSGVPTHSGKLHQLFGIIWHL